MDFPTQVKLALYRHFATTGRRPSAEDLAGTLNVSPEAILEAFRELRAKRVLLLDHDGASIRMAPPFSGVPTQHVVFADGITYFANCAWDAFGIPAALKKPGRIESRCEHTLQPLRLDVPTGGPWPSDWIFHCEVPASHWWDDLVYT